MNILITGSQGYLGQIVLKKLHHLKDALGIQKIIGLDIHDVNSGILDYTYIKKDIRDTSICELCIEHKVTHIVHLAAILNTQNHSREFLYDVDVLGTKNILEAAVAANAEQIIISSSGAAYGYHADNPNWLAETDPLRGNDDYPYSHHKKLIEEMMADYKKEHPKLHQVIFRVCTILGKTTDNLITDLFKKKNIIGIRGYESPFVFVWDEDIANCMVQAVEHHIDGIFNVAGNGSITNKDIASILQKKYRNIPSGILSSLLWIGKKLKLSQYGPEQLIFLKYRPVLNNQKLIHQFPYTLQKTSLETFHYYLSENQIPFNKEANIQIQYPNN